MVVTGTSASSERDPPVKVFVARASLYIYTRLSLTAATSIYWNQVGYRMGIVTKVKVFFAHLPLRC